MGLTGFSSPSQVGILDAEKVANMATSASIESKPDGTNAISDATEGDDGDKSTDPTSPAKTPTAAPALTLRQPRQT